MCRWFLVSRKKLNQANYVCVGTFSLSGYQSEWIISIYNIHRQKMLIKTWIFLLDLLYTLEGPKYNSSSHQRWFPYLLLNFPKNREKKIVISRPLHFEPKNALFKVQIYWEGHKIWKNLPLYLTLLGNVKKIPLHSPLI